MITGIIPPIVRYRHVGRPFPAESNSTICESVIAGAIIGTVIALVMYHVWWPSPFSCQNFDTMAMPLETHRTVDVVEEESALLGEGEV